VDHVITGEGGVVMDFKRIIIQSLVFSFILVILFGCSEQRQISPANNSSLIATGAQILNVAGSWAEPIEVAQQVFQTPQAEIWDVDLAITQQGDRLIAWEASQYAPAWNVSTQIQYRSAGSANWQSNAPFDSSTLAAAPRLFTHPNTNIAYVMWQVLNSDVMTTANDTFISQFTPVNGWGVPIKIGQFSNPDAALWTPNTAQYNELIMSATGDATLFWITIADNGTRELHARHYSASNGLSSMATQIMGEPGILRQYYKRFTGVTDSNGMTHIYWVTLLPASSPGISALQLWYKNYTPDSGWGIAKTVEQGQFSNSNNGLINIYDLFAIADPNSADHALIIPVSSNEITTTYMLRFNQGQWQALEEVATSNAMVEYSMTLATNGVGQAVVVWPELDYSAETVTLQGRTFSFAGGWEVSKMITTRQWNGFPSVYRIPSENTLRAALNNNGAMGIIWNERDAALPEYSSYYAALFDPAMGWGEPTPIGNNNYSQSMTTAAQFKIDNNNLASVVWVNRSLSGQQMTYRIMLQEHNPEATANLPASVKENSVSDVALRRPVLSTEPLVLPRKNNTVTTRRVNRLRAEQPGKRILDAWDPPVKLGSAEVARRPERSGPQPFPIPGEPRLGFFGPKLWGDNQDNVFAYWDFSTETQLEMVLLRRETRAGDWLPSSANYQSLTLPSPTSHIAIDESTGIAYAMLHTDASNRQADIYVSRFEPNIGWGEPQLVGQGLCCGALFIDANGDATALWEDPENNLIARRYIHATGWQTPMISVYRTMAETSQLLSYSDFNQFDGSPITIAGYNDGRLLLVKDSDTFAPNPSLTLIHFDPVTGWEAPTTVSLTDQDFRYVNQLALHTNQLNNAATLIGSPQLLSNDGVTLMSTSLDNNVWSASQSINPSANTLGLNWEQDFVSAGNNKGEIMLLTLDAMPTTEPKPTAGQLQAYFYSPDRGWQKQTALTQAISLLDNRVPGSGLAFYSIEQLKVAINENSEAAAVWVDNSLIERALYVSHYTPATGWGMRELVTTVDGWVAGFDQVDLHLDDNGNTNLIWAQVTPNGITIMHDIYTTVHHKEGTIAAPEPPAPAPIPNAPAWPAASDTWSKPSIVWQPTNENPWELYRLGAPQLVYDGKDSVYLSAYADLSFDQSSRPPRFANHENALLRYGVDGTWSDSLPPLSLAKNVVDAIQLATDSITGGIYGAWAEGNELYVSNQKPSADWLAPQLLSNNVDDFYLLSDNLSGAYLLWRTTADSLTINLNYLTTLPSGELEVQPNVPITAPAGFASDKPAVNQQGELAVLWVTENSGTPMLSMLTYAISSGWNTTHPLQDFSVMDSSLGLLAAALDNDWVVVSRSLAEQQLFSARFSLLSGWKNWASMDGNVGQIDIVLGQPKLASNRQGSAMLLWQEETRDNTGVVYRIYSSQFMEAADSQGNFWSQPQAVGETPYLAYHETPNLHVSEDGRALALWANYNDELSTILANKYSPGTGWLAQPETIAVADKLFGKPLIDPVGTIRSDGKIIVVFKNTVGIPGPGFTVVESQF